MLPLIHQQFVDRCLSPRIIQWTITKCKTLGQFCESLYLSSCNVSTFSIYAILVYLSLIPHTLSPWKLNASLPRKLLTSSPYPLSLEGYWSLCEYHPSSLSRTSEFFGMLCVTKDWESPWSHLPRWRTYPATTSNPRRPHFGLSFYDENKPIENVLTSATRPHRLRNPQPIPPSSPALETSPLPVPIVNPIPTTGPAPLAPTVPPVMSSHTSKLKAALPANFSGKNDDATQCYMVCIIKSLAAHTQV